MLFNRWDSTPQQTETPTTKPVQSVWSSTLVLSFPTRLSLEFRRRILQHLTCRYHLRCKSRPKLARSERGYPANESHLRGVSVFTEVSLKFGSLYMSPTHWISFLLLSDAECVIQCPSHAWWLKLPKERYVPAIRQRCCAVVRCPLHRQYIFSLPLRAYIFML